MKQSTSKVAMTSTSFVSGNTGNQSYIIMAQNSLRVLDKPTLGECWVVENSVGVHIQETYSRLKDFDRVLYVKNLKRAFELAEEATKLAARMSREEALAAIKKGCEVNKSLGWTAEEGLIDPTGWYKARLHIFDGDDTIGVYIIEHDPFWEDAYSGWQEFNPQGNWGGFGEYPKPSIDLAIFTRMVAGLIKLSPNGEVIHIDMDDNNAYYTKVGDAVEAELEKLSDRELAAIWYNCQPIMLEDWMVCDIVANIFNKTYDDKFAIGKDDFVSFIYKMRDYVASKRQGFSYETGEPFLKDIFGCEYTAIEEELRPLIDKRFDEYFEEDYASHKEYWDDDRLPWSHGEALEQMRASVRDLVINSDEGVKIILAHRPKEVSVHDWIGLFE